MRPCTIAAMLAPVLLTGCCLTGRCLTGLYGDDEFQHYVQRTDAMTMSSGDVEYFQVVLDGGWEACRQC